MKNRPSSIAITSHKGGTHKTTMAINIAVKISSVGNRVLFVDLDNQTNATDHILQNMPPEARQPHKTMTHILAASDLDRPFVTQNAIMPTPWPNLYLIAADNKLSSEAARIQSSSFMAYAELGKALSHINSIHDDPENGFDVVIFDCPPDLDILTTGAIHYSSHVIIPLLSGSKYSLDGMFSMISHIRAVSAANSGTKCMGCVISGWLDNRKAHTRVFNDVRHIAKTFDVPLPLIKHKIPLAASVEQATSEGKSIFDVTGDQEPINIEYSLLCGSLSKELSLRNKVTTKGFKS